MRCLQFSCGPALSHSQISAAFFSHSRKRRPWPSLMLSWSRTVQRLSWRRVVCVCWTSTAPHSAAVRPPPSCPTVGASTTPLAPTSGSTASTPCFLPSSCRNCCEGQWQWTPFFCLFFGWTWGVAANEGFFCPLYWLYASCLRAARIVVRVSETGNRNNIDLFWGWLKMDTHRLLICFKDGWKNGLWKMIGWPQVLLWRSGWRDTGHWVCIRVWLVALSLTPLPQSQGCGLGV